MIWLSRQNCESNKVVMKYYSKFEKTAAGGAGGHAIFDGFQTFPILSIPRNTPKCFEM
jgi:hypothetical protein